MEIPEKALQNIVRQTVNVGDVFLVELDKNNGIIPKSNPFKNGLRQHSWLILASLR